MEHLHTTQELAAHLRVESATIRAWVRAGRIPVVRISRRALRFDLPLVLAALGAQAGQGYPGVAEASRRQRADRPKGCGGAA